MADATVHGVPRCSALGFRNGRAPAARGRAESFRDRESWGGRPWPGWRRARSPMNASNTWACRFARPSASRRS